MAEVVDEIEKRLSEASGACIKSYTAWRKDPKEGKNREELMEAVHELRKVGARLEIEIAVSERDEMAAKPIPIPPHRSSRRGGGEDHGSDDSIGNVAGGGNGGSGATPRGGGGHRGPRRQSRGGGGRSHGGGGGQS